MSKKIKVALVGVGNCAAAFYHGLDYYGRHPDAPGMITPEIHGYTAADIEVVAAFDVTTAKVGKLLNEAVEAAPNDGWEFVNDLRDSPVTVLRGPTLDGLGTYLRDMVEESPAPVVDVPQELRQAGAEVLVNYLPVGSEKATAYYAFAALEAGCAFVNCIPSFIASDPQWSGRFAMEGLPIIGDDIKSQVGATIVHRALATLFRERGVHLDRSYQLNVGGNADFYNMLERERLLSKKKSKTQAVQSIAGVDFAPGDLHVGPSDHVPWLGDRKFAFIRLEGRSFGGAPLNVELKLEVWDSPNSAGVVLDAVRCARVALDRKIGGPLKEASAWYMKSPPAQMDDSDAEAALRRWLVEF